MPVTVGKLRHILKAKHPYIERNLGSVVSIIRYSIQNSSAFEAAAKQLKEARMEMVMPINELVFSPYVHELFSRQFGKMVVSY